MSPMLKAVLRIQSRFRGRKGKREVLAVRGADASAEAMARSLFCMSRCVAAAAAAAAPLLSIFYTMAQPPCGLAFS